MTAFCKAASFGEYFPLRNPSEEVVGQLYQCMWAWQDCATCTNRGCCTAWTYRWALRPTLETFGAFYRKATFRYTSDDWFSSSPMLRSHEELQLLIRFIMERPELPREVLTSKYFSQNSYPRASDSDKDRAMNLAYSVIGMLPCAERNRFHLQYRVLPPVIWKKHQGACEVWEAAMPIGKTLTQEEAHSVATGLSAKRLQECGFKIVDTNDVRLHLVYDSAAATRRVFVFHQVGFLKEHLSYQMRRGPETK